MTREGGPRAEVRALLEPALPYLGAARRRCRSQPLALVLIGPDRDPTVCDAHGVPWQMVTINGRIQHVGAAALDRVREFAREYAPGLVRFLEEDAGPGATWCLVLATDGVAVHAIRWPDESAPPPPSTLN